MKEPAWLSLTQALVPKGVPGYGKVKCDMVIATANEKGKREVIGTVFCNRPRYIDHLLYALFTSEYSQPTPKPTQGAVLIPAVLRRTSVNAAACCASFSLLALQEKSLALLGSF